MVRLNRLDLALKDFTAAIAIAPREARHYAGRGALHQHLGELDLALADYEKLMEYSGAQAHALLREHKNLFAPRKPGS